MKRRLKTPLLLFLGAAFSAFAQSPKNDTVLIDFGSVPSPMPWNNISSPANGRQADLWTSRGWNSGIALSVFDAFNTVNTNGALSPDPRLGFPASATGDSFFGNTKPFSGQVQPTGGITLTSLDPSRPYTLILFASRDAATDNREGAYLLQGRTQATLFLDASSNTSKTVSTTLYPDASGAIRLTISPGPKNNNANGFFYLNAMKLVYPSPPQREPTSLTLLSPNGGEFWQAGKTPSIRWQAAYLDQVRLEYSANGGTSWNPIAVVPAYTQSYAWTTPNMSSKNCLIRISADTFVRTSRSAFEIAPDTSACPIVVIGSSTAAGAGASHPDSAWVSLFRNAVFQKDTRLEVVNLARRGYSSYQLLPDGTPIPPGVQQVIDTARNITKALSYRPCAVVVNLPSNDASNFYPAEWQLANFRLIAQKAYEAEAQVWVSTTQPRNFQDPVQIQIQRDVRDSLFALFGDYTLDFWSVLAEESSGYIFPALNSGDGIHVNNIGHRLLFEQALAKQIDLISCTPMAMSARQLRALPKAAAFLTPNATEEGLLLEFETSTPGEIELRLFGEQGHLVGIKKEPVPQAGRHTLSWNLNGLSPQRLQGHVLLREDSGLKGGRFLVP